MIKKDDKQDKCKIIKILNYNYAISIGKPHFQYMYNYFN